MPGEPAKVHMVAFLRKNKRSLPSVTPKSTGMDRHWGQGQDKKSGALNANSGSDSASVNARNVSPVSEQI